MVERNMPCSNGREIPVGISLGAVEVQEGMRGTTAVDDIGGVRKHAAEALRSSEIRYRRLFEAAQDDMLILDFAIGRVVDVSPFLTNLSGYSHAEFVGKDLWEIGALKDISANRLSFTDLQTKGIIRYDDFPLETRGGR
jgi:PAS domain S-box-containing protein